MMYQPDLVTETGPLQTRWRGPEESNRLDCETGVLLRMVLEPVFRQSSSWAGLRRRLAGKGFDLGFYLGRLVLNDRQSGARICSCKFLGYPLGTLAKRLGRAKVAATRNGNGLGLLLD
ncbi:hypothetical protein KUV26_21285 [Leisingera daeponensis]|uniref:Uncharacterized protein n=1 Tax=Leisingera daeponensis TaxID=405746 RepID=A0ABS7NLA6_9RHOB|nr:hypothetical protein [Leisingera daeponensis]MBY6141975.1 hypothetical protein [Leisingera daeponensis]